MLELDGTLIIAMISFVIFGFIMNIVLYKPVIKIIEERKAFLAKNETTAVEAVQKSDELLEKKAQELSIARAEAKELVSRVTEKFKSETKNIVDDFSKEQKDKTEAEKAKILDEFLEAKQKLDADKHEISDMILQKIIKEGAING